MFLILLRYKKPLADVDRFVVEHRQFLKQHYDAGTLLLSGPREPRDGGIIMAKAGSRQVIEDIIHADPFYREGIADYEIIEFKPVMHAPSLADVVATP